MRIILLLPMVFLLFLTGCNDAPNNSSKPQGAAQGRGHGAPGDGRETRVYTHFSKATELFVEFPVLTVGQESPFAAHLTRLDNFHPVDNGEVIAILSGGGKEEERFVIKKPSIPGIFRPVAKPKYAVERNLVIELKSKTLSVKHDLGKVMVHASLDKAPKEGPDEEDGNISYLKETQWQVEFAHRPVIKRKLRASIITGGVIRSRYSAYGSEVYVYAPASGVLKPTGKAPLVGRQVKPGQLLAHVGGVPVRSRSRGTVVQSYVAAGYRVQRGQQLLRIVDLSRLWVELQIPESDLARLQSPNGVWFQAEGNKTIHHIENGRNGRLVSFSGTVDPKTRTVPLIFEFKNRDTDLRLGRFVQAHVYTGKAVNAISVPVTALVDDGGQSVVYVMVDGEAFERRVVQTGIHDGQYVEIRSGLKAGERVVTTGAYWVRLAASSPAEAGHGHAH